MEEVRNDQKDNERVHTGCFCCDALKDVVDKGVQDGHCLVGDTGIRVHLP